MITEVKREDIPQNRKAGTVKACAEATLAEFLESGFDACEVDPPSGVKRISLAPCMSTMVKDRKRGIRVVTRKGRIFLLRGDADV